MLLRQTESKDLRFLPRPLPQIHKFDKAGFFILSEPPDRWVPPLATRSPSPCINEAILLDESCAIAGNARFKPVV